MCIDLGIVEGCKFGVRVRLGHREVLAFHTQRGATVVKLVQDARPADVANQGPQA